MVTLQPSTREGRFQVQVVTRDGRYLPSATRCLAEPRGPGEDSSPSTSRRCTSSGSWGRTDERRSPPPSPWPTPGTDLARSARPAGPGHRGEPADRCLGRVRRPWGDRGSGRGGVGHGRWRERDRAGRPGPRRSSGARCRPGGVGQPGHRGVPRWGVVVHRAGGGAGAAGPEGRPGRGGRRSPGSGSSGITTTLMGRCSPLPGRQPHRPCRSREGGVEVVEPPTGDQGVRRVWSDWRGRIWGVGDAGQLGRYDPADGGWREWRLPGVNPMASGVSVEDNDQRWLRDFAANALVRFDPPARGSRSWSCRARRPTCGSSWAGPARCGAPSPAWTSSSSSPPARTAATAPSWPTVQAMAWPQKLPAATPTRLSAVGIGAGRMGRPGGELVARKCSAAASPPGTVGATAAWPRREGVHLAAAGLAPGRWL